MSAIDKIQRVKLRDVWKHEAIDFTAWLENNIDVVNECVGLNLGSVRREKNAGDFNVDLVAEDESGNLVIIENQLEKSNHDHLGKLITYLTVLEAKAAIWIVSEPRPEHVRAIAWLNESRAAAFYLVKVEAIRIGNSPAAPLLTLITGPSEEATEVGDTKKEIAERHIQRKKFWTALLALARNQTKLHSSISPGIYNWVGTSAGVQGLAFNYAVRQHDAQVELYIDRDKETGEGNRAILDKLQANKDSIEKEFGNPLLWETLDEKRACRIRYIVSIGGWQDEEKWPQAHEALINAMIRLEKALRPYLKNL
jgi:hypothetical protein